MDARQASLRARTAMVLVCALAFLPAAQARANTPPEPVAPSLEQQQPAAPEPLAPTQQPLEPEVAPQEPTPTATVPAPKAIGRPEVAAEVPDGASPPAPAPSPAPREPSAAPPQVRVAPPPLPPARAKVETLMRRVDRRVGRARSDLRAGRKPREGSLRNLRQDVQALPPAVLVLERNADARGDLDVEGVKRRLRRVLATTGSLVAALARSGIDTPETGRLARVLAELTGVGFPTSVPGAPGENPASRRAPHVGRMPHAPSEAGAQPAYTQPVASPPRSRSGVAGGSPETSMATDPTSLMRLDTPTDAGQPFVLAIVAVALLLVLTLSNSVVWLVMGR
jgi:hypothetical protein